MPEHFNCISRPPSPPPIQAAAHRPAIAPATVIQPAHSSSLFLSMEICKRQRAIETVHCQRSRSNSLLLWQKGAYAVDCDISRLYAIYICGTHCEPFDSSDVPCQVSMDSNFFCCCSPSALMSYLYVSFFLLLLFFLVFTSVHVHVPFRLRTFQCVTPGIFDPSKIWRKIKAP